MIRSLLVLAIATTFLGCGGSEAFSPLDGKHALFWDRQTTESAELLRELAGAFNADYTGVPIKVERAGNYGDIFRKVSASIQARALPAMAVAYESMTTEYIPTGAVTPLDAFVHDPEQGFGGGDLDDFFPAVIENSTFHEFEGKMYSFPFMKSVLMLYFNQRVLEAAGLDAPPRTWVAFLEQARRIKEKTGKHAYAISVDCSTVNAMIFSHGGEIIQGRKTLYGGEASIRVFELIQTLIEEDLAYQVTPGTFEDEVAFSKDEVAFVFRTSAGRAPLMRLMGKEGWGMAPIPQTDPEHPATVLFGPSVVLFNTTPEQQAAAWAFVKYFHSPGVTVRWSVATGYLPMRRSVAEDPRLQASWAEWPYNRAAYDCLPFARPEPNVAGWQEVRDLVARAETEVLTRSKSGREAALDLKRAADAVLARH